jgi:serine/threonine protein kinase/transcriptional regulator with XRE-family HTH domain
VPTERHPERRAVAANNALGVLRGAGLTTVELARATGVTPRTLRQVEARAKSSPRIADRIATLHVAIQTGEQGGLNASQVAQWLRSRHASLGMAPLDAVADDSDAVLRALWRDSAAAHGPTGAVDGARGRIEASKPIAGRDGERASGRRPGTSSAPAKTIKAKRTTWAVGSEIGRGGTSIVCEAVSVDGERGAVKLFSTHRFDDNPEARVRLEREATHLNAINHPNVIGVLDTGEVKGMKALVLERADLSLYELLSTKPGPLPLARAVSYLGQALSGLQAIHAQGLVHRDVTPKNLLIFAGDRLAVADLGAVRHYDDATITGARMGSLLYISSEQLRNPRLAKARDDIFSVGQIAYQMLTGQLPHGNPDPLAVACPDVPLRLIDAIEAMRAHRGESRPQSADEAAGRLVMDGNLAIEVALRAASRDEIDDAILAMRQAYVESLPDNVLIRNLQGAAASYKQSARVVEAITKWLGHHTSSERTDDEPTGESEHTLRSRRRNTPGPLERLVEKGRTGHASDVDELMEQLANANLATTKFIDYALGLVQTEEGLRRMDFYLFNGSQRQRNYAALYFRRRGDRGRLRTAVTRGAVDRAQALSK